MPVRTPLEPRILGDIRLTDFLRSVAQDLRALAQGKATVADGYTSAPTEPGQVGDFALNAAPTELGSPGSKYLVHGWRMTASGWVQVRTLTGN